MVYPTVPSTPTISCLFKGFYRFCVPVSLNAAMAEYTANIQETIDSMDFLARAITDVWWCRYLITGSSIIAIIIGFIWMVVIKSCAYCIVWTAIVLFLLALVGLTYLLYD